MESEENKLSTEKKNESQKHVSQKSQSVQNHSFGQLLLHISRSAILKASVFLEDILHISAEKNTSARTNSLANFKKSISLISFCIRLCPQHISMPISTKCP